VTDLLIGQGFEVHVVDNFSGGKKENVHKDATLHVLDIRDTKELPKVLAGATYLFHLAALPRVQYSIEYPLETHDVNVTGTWNLFIAAKNAGVKKIIYSASSSAYGDQTELPLRESMNPLPKSPYGAQKYIGEVYVRIMAEVFKVEAVSLRYFNVYGPRFNPEGAYALVIGKFLNQRKAGQPLTITGDGKQTRDFTHVYDVARANLLAMQSDTVGKGEVINVGAGNNQSILRIAELVGGPVEFIPARFEPHDSLADNSKARTLLGWQPKVSIEEGIAELKKIYSLA